MSGDAEKTRAELIAELEDLRAQATDSNVATARDALSESEERYRIVTEVCRDAITVTNEAGEVIFTEPSYKYSLAEIDTLAENSGFEIVQQRFALFEQVETKGTKEEKDQISKAVDDVMARCQRRKEALK